MPPFYNILFQSEIRSVGRLIDKSCHSPFATSIAKWPTPVVPADFRLGPGQLHFNPIREQVGTSAHAETEIWSSQLNGLAIWRSYQRGYQHHLVNRARANDRESWPVSR